MPEWGSFQSYSRLWSVAEPEGLRVGPHAAVAFAWV